MIQFTPLNADAVPSQAQILVDPLDAPFRECEKEYNLALRRDHDSAKETYKRLLKHELMRNPADNNGIPLAQRITRLKYCILRNYGEIWEKEYEMQKTRMDAQNAIEYYNRALQIDPSDHSIRLKIGKLAMSEEINDREAALSAFKKILEDIDIISSSANSEAHSALLETVPRRIKPSGQFISTTVASHNVHLQHTTWTGLGELLLDTYDGMMSGRIKLESDTHISVTSRRIIIDWEITKPSATIDVNKSIITKLDPDFWPNDQSSNIDDQIDKFLEYFTKSWTFHISREDHGDMIEQAINTSRFILSYTHISLLKRPKATSDPRFYRFTPNTNPYIPSSYFIDTPEAHSMLITFIEKMNDINSGILDCLCMYVMHLFGHFVRSDDGTLKALWLYRWPDSLKEVMRAILSRIDRRLLEMIENSCTSWDEKSDLVEIMMNNSEDNIFMQMKQKSEVDTTPPKNHNTTAVDLDHETAELLFREIRNYLNQKSDKMYKAWAIKNDVKDTWKTRHFLEDDINFYEAVQYKEHNHDVKELGSVSSRDSDRDYGYQVYAMMSEPMSMEAFSLSPSHAETWRKPDDAQACQFAAYCFGKALELESQLLKQSDIANISPEYTPNDTPNGTEHNTPYGTPETPTNSSVSSANGSATIAPIVRDWRCL
ncbi:9567_t:CDS:10 [Racocetra fulgida]|uniref:9567_t:CDS:1 n=1 Tax=Racocetra fulgida TaxID=60492 RepID=A0A9N8WT89_9GLOM|nr:9567_t:CDS:10 [Racocetra fulgida]